MYCGFAVTSLSPWNKFPIPCSSPVGTHCSALKCNFKCGAQNCGALRHTVALKDHLRALQCTAQCSPHFTALYHRMHTALYHHFRAPLSALHSVHHTFLRSSDMHHASLYFTTGMLAPPHPAPPREKQALPCPGPQKSTKPAGRRGQN